MGKALVVCRHPVTKKYLAVHQTANTWFVPGGRVDAPQAFTTAAVRECIEEARIYVELKGILRIERSKTHKFPRIRIIFYGEPKDLQQVPKQKPDSESIEAAYLSIQEILALKGQWRGPELYGWAKYLQEGGIIHPLTLLREIDVSK